MYQVSSQSRVSGAIPASAGRRRLVVQANDAQGAGPGTVNKPMMPPSMNRPMAPQPQLTPLPQRQNPQPNQPTMPRPPAPGTNGPDRPAQMPLQRPPGAPNRPMAQPVGPNPVRQPPTGVPLQKPPMQQPGGLQAPPSMQPSRPQQPMQPPQPGRPAMAPPLARPGAVPLQQPQVQRPAPPPQGPPAAGTAVPPPAVAAPQPPTPTRPAMQPQMRPASAGAPGQPPSIGLQRPHSPVARTQPPLSAYPAPGQAAAAAAAGPGLAAKPPMPAFSAPPPPAAAGPGLAAKPSMFTSSAPSPLPPPPAAVPRLSPKPPMPSYPAPGQAAAGGPPGLAARPQMPARPGQIGLNRPPAFNSPPSVTLNRPAPPQVEIKRPEMPQAATTARTEISLTRPVMPTPAERTAAAEAAAEEQRKATGRLGKIEVIEEDEDVVVDEDEDEKKGKKKKGKGKKEKVTAEMKRAARKQRETEREEKAAAARREREEIFEVGEEGMSLEALADAIQVDPSDIMRTLFMKGIMLSMNQVLDKNTCKLVASEYDLLVVDKEEAGVTAGAVKQREFLELDDLDDAQPRPPVVTVMGHVDHGKTSLLDFIRKAKVAAGEAGGITQAIGAYNVDVEVDGEKKTICFLDTPGHEAFSAMRARGARVTDIAIIIVAADDGVQPQTREAVSHAQAAEVPIVVAINKIDKPGADPERAKQGLLELNLVPEEWGGSTPMVPVSAKKGTGIDDLLQTVLWVAEEKQLMANANKLAAGTVIEAHLDKKRGPVATLLVQAGTLKVGDIVSCGACYGKVRTLSNAAGSSIREAGPSIAVQLIGLNAVPQAGDEFQAHSNEGDARAMAQEAQEGLRAARIAEMSTTGSMVTLSSLATIDEDTDTLQRMNLIIKGDTSGVVEAIKGALQALPQESVVLRYLLCAAGDITVSDIDLAAASSGMVVGFNLNPDEAVLSHAKRLGVTINTYKVIYNLIDDVKAAMEGKLRQVEERLPVGTATVKAVFGSGKKKVAGCLVDEGKLQKGATIEVTRGKQGVVFNGKLASLRRIKDSVEEVPAGMECGVGAEDWLSWQEGDVINCYMTVTKSQRLEEAKAQTAVDVASL